MATNLKPYNPRAVCPKCGGCNIATQHHSADGNLCRHDWSTRGQCETGEEHIARSCERCGYAWAEAPAGVLGRAMKRIDDE